LICSTFFFNDTAPAATYTLSLHDALPISATGELLWIHGEREGARGGAAPRQLSGRGLAYWSDGRDERIFYVTPGYRLICLDAKTGLRVASFANKGEIDLKMDDDQEIFPDLTTGEI